MKESHFLFSKRPFAIISAAEVKLERHKTLLDELTAMKLGFPIRQLQYTRLTLKDKQ